MVRKAAPYDAGPGGGVCGWRGTFEPVSGARSYGRGGWR
jgi:hypothetical protein